MSGVQVMLPAEVVEQIAQRVAEIILEQRRSPEVAVSAPRWLTIGQAAAHIGAKPQRIYDLRSSGRLTRHADGRRALIDRDELDMLVERGTGV